MNKNSIIIHIVIFQLLLKLSLSPWASGDNAILAITYLNYLTDFSILSIGIYLIPEMPKKYIFVYVSLAFAAACLFLSGMLNGTSVINSWIYLIRIYLPVIYMLILIKVSVNNFDLVKIASKRLLAFSIFLLVVGLIILPSSYNRFEYWWPSYFGGVHTTAYVAVALFYISCSLLYVNKIKLELVIFLLFLVVYSVALGWGVRTALLGLFVFIALNLFDKIKVPNKVLIPILLLIFIISVPSLINFFMSSDQLIDEVSSGRISMYKAKIDQLTNNGLLQWLFGNGYGSDLIETDIWWTEKGAHNDYLTFMVEGGIFFCFTLLYLLFKLYSIQPHKMGKYMIISFAITSLFSNGMIVRPLPSYLFFTAFTILFFSTMTNYEKSNNAQ